jgi:hypothetical protein
LGQIEAATLAVLLSRHYFTDHDDLEVRGDEGWPPSVAM